MPEPEPVRPALDQMAVPGSVRVESEAVEEHVARHLQRPAQGERAVHRVARVPERDAADVQVAAVEQHRVR